MRYVNSWKKRTLEKYIVRIRSIQLQFIKEYDHRPSTEMKTKGEKETKKYIVT